MPKDVIECMLEFREVTSGSTDDGDCGETRQLSKQVSVTWYKQGPEGVDGGVYVNIANQDVEELHAQMTRHEINRLIRSLRRARDGAFGSDA